MRFTEFKEYKKGKAGQLKGKDAFKKSSKPGGNETPHPARGKLVGESILKEGARIEHMEDLVFRDLPPSKGANRALQSLIDMEKGAHKDVTVKWDGSPAVIFGRDEDGEFIFTDKSGFTAKGYDGRSKSAKDLESMLMARPGASNPDPKKRQDFKAFVARMKDVYDEFEKATPKDYRGFFKGDMLYFNTPQIEGDNYVFEPNIVKYYVSKNSELGKKIARSKTGIVIHREVDAQGNEGPLKNKDIFQGEEVLVVPPVTASSAPKIDDTGVKELKAVIAKDASAMDSLLDMNTLTQLKLKKLPEVFYAYMNSKVDTGLENLGGDFLEWIKNRNQLSEAAKKKIAEYIGSNQQGFKAMWEVVAKIQRVKDDVIAQLDKQDIPVKQSMSGDGESVDGGEGYVLAHPEGDIKLVPRQTFSKFNRAKVR